MTDKQQEQPEEPREGQPERSGGGPSRGAPQDPEVLSRPTRRRFSAEYKSKMLREAEACTEPGAIGALLRREGLYSSHLANWRRQEAARGRAGLEPNRRGPKPSVKPSQRELKLEREKRDLEKRLAKAEAIIAFQKKVHALLEIPLSQPENDEDDS